MLAVLIVPQGLIWLIFDAYHASGVDGHLGINKTILLLQTEFLWPNMRKTIIKWVRACPTCIATKNLVNVLQQLIQSWPLLTPFPVIFTDLWSPGDVVSSTGATKLLNCMCDITSFVVSVAITYTNAAELAQAFMENVLLKFGLCLAVVVDNGSIFMGVFTQTMKSLNIHLHRVSKRNYNAVGVERYYRFLNHNVIIVADARETPRCFVEAGLIAAFAWNVMLVDGTDILHSVPAIGCLLNFPIDIAIEQLPLPIISDAAKATVSYMRHISKDARFACELTTWLTTERRNRHRERVNKLKSAV